MAPSFRRKPVLEAIADRVEPTLLLTLLATAVSVVIGVPAGIVAARRHNSVADQSLMVLALLGISVPNFLLGLLLILVCSVQLGWFPVAGYSPLEDGWLKTLRSLVLPAFALGFVQSRLIARITRSSMLDVLREQFILAGRAKGLAERAIVYKHALKNAMIPTVTIIGISFAILIGGAIVPSWGNILSEGRLYLRQAPWLVLYPGAAIMVTILGLNLVGDGLRDLLDPKIRGLQTERQRAA